MCIQDFKMGRHKSTMLVNPPVSTDGKQHPGSQTSVPIPQISWSLPRIFIAANPLRTALRLVLANPGIINTETNLFEERDTYVTGYIWNGPPNPTGTINTPLFAMLSVHNRANMSDMVRIEDVGNILLGQWMFVPMFNLDADIAFGGYTVWDIQGDKVLMQAAQEQPEI